MAGLADFSVSVPDALLHGLRLEPFAPGAVAILVVPGFSESAEDYVDLLDRLPRGRSLAISLRGRGRSEAPPTGYAIDSHADDIAAVVAEVGRAHLVSFSASSAYAIRAASKQPEAVSSLTMVDYPPVHRAAPDGWAEVFRAATWRGKTGSERLRDETLQALLREGTDEDMWEELAQLKCPVQIIAASAEHGSLLSAADMDRFVSLERVKVIKVLGGCGHDVLRCGLEEVAACIAAFLAQVDAAHPTGPEAQNSRPAAAVGIG